MLNNYLYSIAKMKIWTTQEEGENLKRLFAGINKAEFARNHKFPGGDSMISQNISGHRPMSLEAAVIYTKAFDLSFILPSDNFCKIASGITDRH